MNFNLKLTSGFGSVESGPPENPAPAEPDKSGAK